MEPWPFGKHRGLPACDVPLSYLAWALDAMPKVPPCILEELRRRAASHGSRQAVEAQAVLSNWGYRSARKRVRRARRTASSGKAVRSRRAPRQDFVGAEFSERRAQWLATGGSESECPWHG